MQHCAKMCGKQVLHNRIVLLLRLTVTPCITCSVAGRHTNRQAPALATSATTPRWLGLPPPSSLNHYCLQCQVLQASDPCLCVPWLDDTVWVLQGNIKHLLLHARHQLCPVSAAVSPVRPTGKRIRSPPPPPPPVSPARGKGKEQGKGRGKGDPLQIHACLAKLVRAPWHSWQHISSMSIFA